MGTPIGQAKLRRLVRAVLGLGTFTLVVYGLLAKGLRDGNDAATVTFAIVLMAVILVFARK